MTATDESEGVTGGSRRAAGSRWRLIALIVLGTLVAAGVGWLVIRDDEPGPGPLYNADDDDFSFPAPAQRPVTWGVPVLFNEGDVPVVLLDARPAKATPGLRVVQVLAGGADRRAYFLANLRRFPPPVERIGVVRPVRGFVLQPEQTREGRRGVELLFGLQMDHPGRYVIDGIAVRYRVGETEHDETFRFRLAVCAGFGDDATDADCALPGGP